MLLKPVLQRRLYERKGPLFLPFPPPTPSPQHGNTQEALLYSVGIVGSPQCSSSLRPLCAFSIYPTANPWQVQWALSPENTMSPPPLLHFYLYTLVQASLVLPDSSFIAQLLLPFSHNPGSTQHPELSLKSINQIMSCPCLKSLKGFPTGQRTKPQAPDHKTLHDLALAYLNKSIWTTTPSPALSSHTGPLSFPAKSLITHASRSMHRLCSLPIMVDTVYACLTFYLSV